ncbi:hypothetical protein AACH06_09700 [Ideonella sp. DXS29W]|uniref:Uncharacterized protein n=1 Tax=Ideonella lacteola TaxID=2984193 RepID=A0ABU9BMA3_9BURK
MIPRSAIVAWACALAGVPAAFAGATWPDPQDPPRSKVEWVSKDIRVNGLPTRIQHFESELSVDEVLGFYRKRWTKAGVPEPREVSAAGWQTIATLQDRYQLLVQVRGRSPQGSEGMLSVADLADMKSDYLPKEWPTWSNMRVLQVTESFDGPKRSHVISMVSDDGYDLNVRRVREEWLRRGYVLAHEQNNPAKAGQRGWVGIFDKASQSVDVTVTYSDDDRRTYITTNYVTATSTGVNR